MRIKCLSRRGGPAALDAVVTISTARGQIEEVVVHRGYVNEGSLEVDYIGDRVVETVADEADLEISGRVIISENVQQARQERRIRAAMEGPPVVIDGNVAQVFADVAVDDAAIAALPAESSASTTTPSASSSRASTPGSPASRGPRSSRGS